MGSAMIARLSPQIRLAPHPIVQYLAHWIVEQAVHREVATGDIGLRAGEFDEAGATAVGVSALSPEGSHLDGGPLHQHQDDTKLPAHGNRLLEQALDLVGCCRSGDVVVLRLHLQEHVAHTSPHPTGFVSGLLQPADNMQRGITHGVILRVVDRRSRHRYWPVPRDSRGCAWVEVEGDGQYSRSFFTPGSGTG